MRLMLIRREEVKPWTRLLGAELVISSSDRVRGAGTAFRWVSDQRLEDRSGDLCRKIGRFGVACG